jgi:hypothetical protein
VTEISDSILPLKANATMRRWLKFSIWTLLLFATVVAVILGCRQWLRGHIHSLPPINDVKSIRVLRFHEGRRSRPGIEVPEKHWKEIFAALSPSKYDPWPCEWKLLADLEIQTKQDQHYRVDLYNLETHPVGAFSIGPTVEQRTYRRGGNSAQLKKALSNVYLESETQKSAGVTGQ